MEAGAVGGGEDAVKMITVSTYDSAYLQAELLGNKFMFIVFDVVAMFLFTWGLAFASMSLSQNYLLLIFIAILVAPLGYASYLAGKRELW